MLRHQVPRRFFGGGRGGEGGRGGREEGREGVTEGWREGGREGREVGEVCVRVLAERVWVRDPQRDSFGSETSQS